MMGQARRRRHAEVSDTMMVTSMGAVDHHDNAAALQAIRQQTHDLAISGAGVARIGGIRWLHLTGDDAIRYLTESGEDDLLATPPGHDQYIEELVAFMRANPHGVLVVAFCPADWRRLSAAMS